MAKKFMDDDLPEKGKGYFGSTDFVSTSPPMDADTALNLVLERDAAMELYFALQAAISEWGTLNFNHAKVKKLRMTLSIKERSKRIAVILRP